MPGNRTNAKPIAVRSLKALWRFQCLRSLFAKIGEASRWSELAQGIHPTEVSRSRLNLMS